MTDIVFTAKNYATLVSEAIKLGFVDAEDNIIVNGPLRSGGAYFLNYVGEIPESSGVWGRLRVNGDTADLPIFSDEIKTFVYDGYMDAWTSDGKTPAPEYVGNIGLIA